MSTDSDRYENRTAKSFSSPSASHLSSLAGSLAMPDARLAERAASGGLRERSFRLLQRLWQDGWTRMTIELAAVYVAISAILRCVLWLRFGREAGVALSHLPGVLACGALGDGIESIYLLLPLTLYWALVPRRLWQLRRHRWLLHLVGLGALFGLLYLCAIEFFFFDEFNARFNLVAVDYLIYPQEVLTNIWEAYPVLWVLILAGIASLVLWLALRRTLGGRLPPRPAGHRWGRLAIHVAMVIAVLTLVSTRTFAGFDHRVADELAINGVSSFFEALHTNEIDYHAHYRTGDRNRLFALLTDHLATPSSSFLHLDHHRLDRLHAPPRKPLQTLAPTGEPPGREMNVVVVVEESLGAEFLGAYGSDQGLSPAFDALAQEGLLFTSAYATGTRTVRGLEAIVASFPPIPSEAILKRPGNEDIATWGKVMRRRGYHTSFLYGGYSYFDNMRSFFSHNGFVVSDRTEIPDPTFANIWGASDQDLFRHALAFFDELEGRGKPFLSLVLTTSNHKPFTFPPGIPGVPERGGGRLAGVRYADYALGEFLRRAADHPWFDDTLFVVVGDHGARVYGAAQIPLYSYEIPILFYAPKRLAAERVATPISLLDIAPTVLGLLGEPYTAPFFGQDVLNDDRDPSRPLLFNHDHDVGLLRGEELVVLGLKKKVEGYRYDRAEQSLTPAPPDPALVDLATAYYQVAYDQFTDHLYR